MILGVEHIAVSCDDIASGIRTLEAAGYRPKFIQKDVTNSPAKKGLLRTFGELHSVAYCQIEGGVSLELTQHTHPLRGAASPYQVLFCAPVAGGQPYIASDLPPAYDEAWGAALRVGRQAKVEQWGAISAQFWSAPLEDCHPGTARAVLIPVGDLGAAERFWTQGLGCRVMKSGSLDDGSGWLQVAFKTPIPGWYLEVILLAHNGAVETPYIDDPGFPCLALITNKLAKDTTKLREMGGREVSDVFHMVMNEKQLNILVLRAPGGELIELIEFGK